MAICPTCRQQTGKPIYVPLYCDLSEIEVIDAHKKGSRDDRVAGIQFARLIHKRSTSGFFVGLLEELKELGGDDDPTE